VATEYAKTGLLRHALATSKFAVANGLLPGFGLDTTSALKAGKSAAFVRTMYLSDAVNHSANIDGARQAVDEALGRDKENQQQVAMLKIQLFEAID
jgi:hypothetical protein